jgi:hypothetical protein
MVITVRRLLLRAALALTEDGVAPANVDNVQLGRVRHATMLLPKNADWQAESARFRDADAGLPVANAVALIPNDDIPQETASIAVQQSGSE